MSARTIDSRIRAQTPFVRASISLSHPARGRILKLHQSCISKPKSKILQLDSGQRPTSKCWLETGRSRAAHRPLWPSSAKKPTHFTNDSLNLGRARRGSPEHYQELAKVVIHRTSSYVPASRQQQTTPKPEPLKAAQTSFTNFVSSSKNSTKAAFLFVSQNAQ